MKTVMYLFLGLCIIAPVSLQAGLRGVWEFNDPNNLVSSVAGGLPLTLNSESIANASRKIATVRSCAGIMPNTSTGTRGASRAAAISTPKMPADAPIRGEYAPTSSQLSL